MMFMLRANCGIASSWSIVGSFTTYGDCSSTGIYAYSSNSTQASSARTFVANTPGDYITITFAAGATVVMMTGLLQILLLVQETL